MCKTKTDENSSVITVIASGHYAEEYQNNTVMRNPNAEEYQSNTVSLISGKISCMCIQLKPGVFSAFREYRVRG